MNDSLHDTLDELLRSGTESNPALNALLGDYTKYHVVLVVVGGLFAVALLSLGVYFWKRFTRAPKVDDRRPTFERKTYFCFGVLSVGVGLLMGVIVAANVSNVLDPRQGFSGAVQMLGTPQTGTQADRLHQAFTTWLQSSSANVPSLVHSKIGDRLAWQRPKAIVSSVLLVVFVVLSVGIWRTLIRKSRVREGRRRPREVASLVAGVGTVTACILLMLMVIGNTQASFAPMTLTLLYG